MATIGPDILRDFARRLLVAAGVNREDAWELAEALVWTDLIGRRGQGVSRLPVYLKRFRQGCIQTGDHPKIIQRRDAVATLDGRDGFGHLAGCAGMNLALELAAQYGVGLVAVRCSNHFGAAAYYVNQAAEHNMLGMAFSNAGARVAAHGGLTPLFGTNPFAFAAPMRSQRPLLIDFSTGVSAMSSLRMMLATGKQVPDEMFVNTRGEPVKNQSELDSGVMKPFGGTRGYCLALMVEILSAVLTRSALSRDIAKLGSDFSRPANVGHMFIAVAIEHLLPLNDYFTLVEELAGFIRSSATLPGVESVLLPGDSRWKQFEHTSENGIALDSHIRLALESLASELGVATPW